MKNISVFVDVEVITDAQLGPSQNVSIEDQLLLMFASQRLMKVLVEKIKEEITLSYISSYIEDTSYEQNEMITKNEHKN